MGGGRRRRLRPLCAGDPKSKTRDFLAGVMSSELKKCFRVCARAQTNPIRNSRELQFFKTLKEVLIERRVVH